ncbi:MAG TPA: adenylate/guanylate cyclase domain-containing protein, partial [Solirubrobacteraceae bacterium]
MSEASVLDAWVCGDCEQANPPGTRFCGHCGRPAAPVPPAPPPAPAAQERRLVTALFADISGFTTLADRLDPDELAEIVDVIVKSLADVVGRHGGFIEKYAGDALLAIFGAPASREDDAERALAVALEMHETLRALLPSLPAAARGLSLHIGVNSGHGIARTIGNRVRTDYGVLGDAINVAQRLESSAAAGETYVGDLTKRLARGRFAFAPVGPLTLKGKPEPVVAWQLTGRGAGGAAADEAPVAREAELGALRAALDRLRAGRGGVIVVTGEAGAGKSSVLDAFEAEARDTNCTWLAAWTPSDAGDLAYAPVVDLLARLAGSPAPTNPAQWAPALARRLEELGLGTRARPLLALAGVAAAELAEVEPEAYARALAESLGALVRAAAAEGPVVLRVEDLHWADDDSLALVAALGADAPDAPFLLLATARTEATSVVARLQTGSRDARVLELGPLDEVGLAMLVARRAGTSLRPEAVAAIQERSGGNPFFATEIVRSLLEAGAPLDRAEAWAEAGLPPTVEGL